MHNKIIAVVGSWRPEEQKDDPKAQDRFFALSKALGALIYDKGCILRVVWSNDHLVRQCSPKEDGGQLRIKVMANGLYSAKPTDVRYLFEATADYHALVGYLDAAKQRPSEGGLVELRISDQMWKGATEAGMVAWSPVLERKIAGQSIQSFVDNGLVRLVSIDGGMEPPYLRTRQVSDLVKGENTTDAVFVLGGGKASEMMCHAAGPRGKLIPLPYCGSKGLEALRERYSEHPEDARLVRIFGSTLLEPEHYKAMSVTDAARQLDGAIESFPVRPLFHGSAPENPAVTKHQRL